jgi:hypothetical protein
MYYLSIASTLSNVHESKLYGQRMTKENTAARRRASVGQVRKATAGAQSHRGMPADWRRLGVVGVAAAAGRAGWTPPVGGGPPRHGLLERGLTRNSATATDLGDDGGGDPVGGRRLGRARVGRPGGAQCCFSCAGARVTRCGGRCGGGGRAAQFRSPLRIGAGCTSLAARLKSGLMERKFCRPAPIFLGLGSKSGACRCS